MVMDIHQQRLLQNIKNIKNAKERTELKYSQRMQDLDDKIKYLGEQQKKSAALKIPQQQGDKIDKSLDEMKSTIQNFLVSNASANSSVNKMRENDRMGILSGLSNTFIGRLFLSYLGIEKGIISNIIEKVGMDDDNSKNIQKDNENQTEWIKNAAKMMMHGDDENPDMKEEWGKIAKNLGIIYGSFYKLLTEVASDNEGNISSSVYDTFYDITSSAVSGSSKAFTHAISSIPPLGAIISVMYLIDTVIQSGSKSIAAGMSAIDPVMEIFSKVLSDSSKGTGDGDGNSDGDGENNNGDGDGQEGGKLDSDCEQLRDVLEQITHLRNMILGDSPNVEMLRNIAYVSRKKHVCSSKKSDSQSTPTPTPSP